MTSSEPRTDEARASRARARTADLGAEAGDDPEAATSDCSQHDPDAISQLEDSKLGTATGVPATVGSQPALRLDLERVASDLRRLTAYMHTEFEKVGVRQGVLERVNQDIGNAMRRVRQRRKDELSAFVAAERERIARLNRAVGLEDVLDKRTLALVQGATDASEGADSGAVSQHERVPAVAGAPAPEHRVASGGIVEGAAGTARSSGPGERRASAAKSTRGIPGKSSPADCAGAGRPSAARMRSERSAGAVGTLGSTARAAMGSRGSASARYAWLNFLVTCVWGHRLRDARVIFRSRCFAGEAFSFRVE